MNYDPFRPHSHDPNPDPPNFDPSFRLVIPGGDEWLLTPLNLSTLPQTAVPGCYIVSTGHGTSGPFTFGGVTLAEFIDTYYRKQWREVEVVSADGFGNRVLAAEVQQNQLAPPILLATHIDGRPLTRQEGAVRLIVPAETDDALRQVKWISEIRIY